MWIIDISDPAHPTGAGFYSIEGYFEEVAIGRGFAYVADAFGTLWVIDVFDPAHPKVAGSYETPGSALAVTVRAGRAYVALEAAGMIILQFTGGIGERAYLPFVLNGH